MSCRSKVPPLCPLSRFTQKGRMLLKRAGSLGAVGPRGALCMFHFTLEQGASWESRHPITGVFCWLILGSCLFSINFIEIQASGSFLLNCLAQGSYVGFVVFALWYINCVPKYVVWRSIPRCSAKSVQVVLFFKYCGFFSIYAYLLTTVNFIICRNLIKPTHRECISYFGRLTNCCLKEKWPPKLRACRQNVRTGLNNFLI